MATAKDPRTIAEKQIRNLANSTPDIEAGIAAVTESPMDKAADNLGTAKANYVAAIDSGKMERNLRAVPLATWKQKTLAKVGRIAEGAEASRHTIEVFHSQRNTHQEGIDRKLDTMPKRTLQDSGRRMMAQMEGMAEFSFDKSKV